VAAGGHVGTGIPLEEPVTATHGDGV
jgi:hypothetical protein